MNTFCVIGLGSFGRSLAESLAKNGHDVLGIDQNEEAVNGVGSKFVDAVCGDATSEAVLRAAGVKDYDCCIVCFENDMESSILVTVLLKELGVRKVVARANSDRLRRVLLKVGADMVIFPEKDMGEKLAYRLSQKDVFSFFNLSASFSIVEMKAPKRWIGKSLKEIDVRRKYGVNIVASAPENPNAEYEMLSDPEHIFVNGERVIAVGRDKDIQKMN